MKKLVMGIVSLMVLTTALVMTTTVDAALPPVYQSTKEYRALLDSPNLTEILGSAEPIVSIVREENGFMVKTNRHSLRVDVIYDPMDHPGPAKFHLQFHNLEPLK